MDVREREREGEGKRGRKHTCVQLGMGHEQEA